MNVLARAMPALRKLSRFPGSSSTSDRASICSSSKCGETRVAASPATSGSDELSLATTGAPHAIASRTGNPKPSYKDGNHTTWAAWYSEHNASSLTKPVSRTESPSDLAPAPYKARRNGW